MEDNIVRLQDFRSGASNIGATTRQSCVPSVDQLEIAQANRELVDQIRILLKCVEDLEKIVANISHPAVRNFYRLRNDINRIHLERSLIELTRIA